MKNKLNIIKVIDWLLHFIAYAVILVLVATYFDSFKIDDNHLYTYGVFATLIIFILNATIKLFRFSRLLISFLL